MTLEALFELRIAGFFDHVGQRFHDLILGVINILQGVYEQVVHIFDVFGEEAHCYCPCTSRRISRVEGTGRRRVRPAHSANVWRPGPFRREPDYRGAIDIARRVAKSSRKSPPSIPFG
jgi:hypothetical protein